MKHNPTRRIALLGALALTTAGAPTLAAAGDPIYAAIMAHRTALAVFIAAPSEQTFVPVSAALDAMVTTVPTTMPGCGALLDYIRHPERTDYPGPELFPEGFEAAVRESLRVALARMV
jgi:hypothetical protein